MKEQKTGYDAFKSLVESNRETPSPSLHEKFKLWDTVEKCYFYIHPILQDMEFDSIEAAEKYKEDFLARGNYPDRPHTVIEIHPIPSIHEEGKNFLCVVPGYGNILCRMDKYVSDTCIYLRVLTGKLRCGLISMAKGEFIEIPESDTIKIIL